MNIVKLKDIIMPEEYSISKFFNENLKGKYAYWIKMRYIFPMESVDYTTYVQFEQLDDEDFKSTSMLPHIDLYSEEQCMIDFSHTYIDIAVTERANNIDKFVISNKYSTDANITVDMIKKFRSWLAKELLDMRNLDLTSDQIHMLEYYRDDMYNDVVKYLDIFGSENLAILTTPEKNSCGCCSNNTTSLYDLGAVSVCNAKNIYAENIKQLMIDTFSSVDFWNKTSIEFLRVFKLYIDNILKAGLPIADSIVKPIVVNCDCNTIDNNYKSMLIELSIALGYYCDNDVIGHKNYIYTALNTWATHLYERMYW